MLTALYPWTLTLHILSMVAWMAGLFYLPRLYVYHAERGATAGEPSETLKIMEEKLLRVIMTPAMISTWIFGLLLAATPGVAGIGVSYWFLVKFLLVLGLSAYHMWLARVRRHFDSGQNTRSGRFYRLMNEVPTLLLVAIVVLVVVKPF